MATVGQLVAAVDHPRLSSYRLATTLRVPIDETVLIGGLTTSGEPEPGERDKGQETDDKKSEP